MSIFKDTFHPDIKAQIDVRQKAINNRTPKNLTYYNSRASWIRLSSSVNTYNGVGDIKDPKSYNNGLAKRYVLQGGTLNENGSLRSGLGDFSKAYSNISSDNTTPYRLGIRPMPGITNVEIRSKGAYGSLREAIVSFQCWDIRQLEDLELLYMRPGYTVLLEWGWSLYLKNDEKLNNIVEYTDIINKTYTKEELFKLQYKKATVDYHGNYDSMFGFVKNYSWKARMDGGYDCQTTIISLGEVIESLKVNYLPLKKLDDLAYKGLLMNNVGITDYIKNGGKELKNSYSKNILAGLFEELYEIVKIKKIEKQSDKENNEGSVFNLKDNNFNCTYNFFNKTIDIKTANGNENKNGPIGKSDEQVYITLESLVSILNNYVLLRDKQANTPFTKLSVFEQNRNITNSNLKTGDGCLLSLAHPLEISVDPSVCLITNKLWTNGIKFVSTNPSTSTTSSNIKYGTAVIDESFWKDIASLIKEANGFNNNSALVAFVKNRVGTGFAAVDNLKEIQRQFIDVVPSSDYNVEVVGKKKISSYDSFYNLLSEALFPYEIEKAIGEKEASASGDQKLASLIRDASKTNPVEIGIRETELKTQQLQKQTEETNKALENIKFLEKLEYPYYVNNDWNSELGIIGNIYLNLGMLYEVAVDNGLAAQDRKEKNDISLYDFIKTILTKISSAIGEVNNFDLWVDSNDNTARIIDINYVDRKQNQPGKAYTDAYTIKMHSLDSVVRSYSLESKIFPEQSTIVAIGAQIEGGALGIDTSTLVDFNKKIIDRIIPIKDAPDSGNVNTNTTVEDKLSIIMSSVSTLTEFFDKLDYSFWSDSDFDVQEVTKYQNALKDLINYYKTITYTKIKNKAIIPTKLSIEMDGIGGIIIGNLFKIPEDILPKGYKGGKDGIGSKIGYIVTGIGHSLQNNDWVTRLEAQTIILDEPEGIDPKYTSIQISQTSDNKAAIPVDINNTQQITPAPVVDGGKGDKDAMKLAGNAVFSKNGEIKSYCTKYTYAIARNYILAKQGKTPDGNLGINGNPKLGVNNAGDLIYRRNLISLGYEINYLGVLSKSKLIETINSVKDIGTIINYRSTKDVGGSDSYWKYGHTQIYTGGVLNTSRGSIWASSQGNNYNRGMVYENTVKSDSWECYIFTLNQ